MEPAQRTGLIIMLVSAFQFVIFFWALTRRSYLALALPVLSALAAVSALAFWIGWTMFTGEDEELDEMSEPPTPEEA